MSWGGVVFSCVTRFPGCAVAVAIICASAGSPALASQAAGQAVAVKTSSTLSNPEGTISLVVGTDVAMGDRIKTNGTGEVQLVFSDETRLVVGPNSALVIEAYLLRSNNRANNFTVRTLGGSFRMITGKSQKSAYKIKTPTATIGVRGTKFDFTVKGSGTAVVLFEGEARVCGQTGRCQTLNRSCSIAEAPRRKDVRVLSETRDRRARIKRDFPYVATQQSLRRDFRVRTTGCGDIAARFDHKDRTRAAARTRQASAAPPDPKPEPGPSPAPPAGNPGNGGPMGKAGANPGNNDFGGPERGRSDSAPGRGNGNGNSNGNGRGGL